MREQEPRGNLYLVTGVVLGLILGLLVSVKFFPVRYANAHPALLNSAGKDEYRLLVAEAWRTDKNLPRALQRLELLQDANPANTLTSQATLLRSQGATAGDVQSLTDLAAILRKSAPTPAATGTPDAKNTAQNTAPPAATATNGDQPAAPTSTPHVGLPSGEMTFNLTERKDVCDDSLPAGYVVVEVVDAGGGPLAGVKVDVAWDGGNDSFYTGLSPKKSLGYGDFKMEAGVKYTVQVGGGEPATDVVIPQCGGAVHLAYKASQ